MANVLKLIIGFLFSIVLVFFFVLLLLKVFYCKSSDCRGMVGGYIKSQLILVKTSLAQLSDIKYGAILPICLPSSENSKYQFIEKVTNLKDKAVTPPFVLYLLTFLALKRSASLDS